MTSTPRKRRANGEESRRRIIDAATEIAAERGYDGTSIAAVSEHSGLPSSSIYWHFANKDDLIAAVIERSFARWRELIGEEPRTEPLEPRRAMADSMRRAGRALVGAPDFLRLGLMLTLERRPEELTARTMFLSVRRDTQKATAATYRKIFGDALGDDGARILALMAVAAADGLFISREIDSQRLDTERAFDLVGIALAAVAEHLIDERSAAVSPRRPRRPRRTTP